VFEKNVSV